MNGVQNYGVATRLGIMRAISMVLGFALKNKATGDPYDLTAKDVYLRIYRATSNEDSTEVEVLEVAGSVTAPESGVGAFGITAANTLLLLDGVEYWYRATIEDGSHVELFAWGPVVPEDGRPA